MDTAQRDALRQRVQEYNREHDLGARISVDGDSIVTNIASEGSVYTVRMDDWLGQLVHEELARLSLHTPVIANEDARFWQFIVKLDLHLTDFVHARELLWNEPGCPIGLSAPSNILVYPKPGDVLRRWVELPPGKERLPLSVVLDTAREMRQRQRAGQ